MRNPTEIIIENGDDYPIRLPLSLESDREKTKRKLIPKLLRLAGRLPFADDIAAAYYCAIDADTPRKATGVLFAALAYFVMPADALPDFLFGLGFTDDATVIATALSIVAPQVKPKHYVSARRLLGLETPAKDA